MRGAIKLLLALNEGVGALPIAPFSLGRTQRIGIFGIGDSNELQDGTGHNDGIHFAMRALGVQAYATGLICQNENGGSGAGSGYFYIKNGSLIGAVSGAPAELATYLDKGTGGLAPFDYTYVADASSVASTTNMGLILQAASGNPDVLDVTADIIFDFHYGTFNSGSGAFRPVVRLEQAPNTVLTINATVSTNTGAFGMQRVSVQAPADPTRAGKQIAGRWTYPGVTGITGPFFGTYMRAVNPNRLTGFSYTTLDYRGGQSARTMAVDLQQASDETLTYIFSDERRLQGAGDKCIIIFVKSGLNDRNETLTSVGPGAVTDGDSPEAFVDNHTAIVERIQAIWTFNGWSQDELHFVFMVSHPQSDPDDAELVSYRTAIAAYAATLDQGYAIDIAAKITSAQILANGWYRSAGADKNHLTQAGYEGIDALVLRA